MRSRCSARSDLVAVHRVGERGQLVGEFAAARAHGEQFALADDAGLLGGVALGLGGRQRGLQPDQRPLRRVADRRSRRPRRARAPAGPARDGAGRRARSRRRAAADRRGRTSPAPAPRRCGPRAAPPSRPGGRAATSACSAVALGGVRFGRLVGGRLGQPQPLLEIGQPGQVACRAPARPRRGRPRAGRPRRTRSGRPGPVGPVARPPPTSARRTRLQRVERLVDLVLEPFDVARRRLASSRVQAVVPGAASSAFCRASSTAARISIVLGAEDEPPADQCAPDDVAVARDCAHGGMVGDQARRAAARSATTATRSSACSTPGRMCVGRADHVGGPDRPGRQRRATRRGRRRTPIRRPGCRRGRRRRP